MATYNYTGTLTYVTVPQGTFTITAAGAQGGSSGAGAITGGLGASVGGDFAFQTSTNLIILVGRAGMGAGEFGGGGGGGGSFVYIDVDNDNAITSSDTLLIAAGGGGGAGYDSAGGGAPGFVPSSSLGGDAGDGGAGGGGGAGVGGAGGTGILFSGGGASSITAGGIGSTGGGNGGFGGGGGGGFDSGGGGGGYGGGRGGNSANQPVTSGFGGTSYIAPAATDASGTAAIRQGNGVVTVTCYVTGTLIRTAAGEVPVERLSVGDLAVTASGAHRPIRWIGTQTLDCRDHAEGREKSGAVFPIRIAAGALGENRPSRDLWVSPRHAICLDLLGEVLVPADALINGATITQERVETITYWHVELDSHDLLIAEGVAAESYLDLGNRGFFDGTEEAIPDAAGPDAALTRADCCRPFVEGGPILDFARARLRERAVALGWSLRPDPLAGLHLVADGQVIVPRVAGTAACFLLPAGCGDVRLVSGTSVPEHATGGGGRRRLGVDLRGLTIDDGLTMRRAVSLDDTRLDAGFHRAEGTGAGLHRWTKGEALLPASLWADCRDVFFLRLELGGEGLLRWHAPEEAVLPVPRVAAGAPQLRLVEAA